MIAGIMSLLLLLVAGAAFVSNEPGNVNFPGPTLSVFTESTATQSIEFSKTQLYPPFDASHSAVETKAIPAKVGSKVDSAPKSCEKPSFEKLGLSNIFGQVTKAVNATSFLVGDISSDNRTAFDGLAEEWPSVDISPNNVTFATANVDEREGEDGSSHLPWNCNVLGIDPSMLRPPEFQCNAGSTWSVREGYRCVFGDKCGSKGFCIARKLSMTSSGETNPVVCLLAFVLLVVPVVVVTTVWLTFLVGLIFGAICSAGNAMLTAWTSCPPIGRIMSSALTMSFEVFLPQMLMSCWVCYYFLGSCQNESIHQGSKGDDNGDGGEASSAKAKLGCDCKPNIKPAASAREYKSRPSLRRRIRRARRKAKPSIKYLKHRLEQKRAYEAHCHRLNGGDSLFWNIALLGIGFGIIALALYVGISIITFVWKSFGSTAIGWITSVAPVMAGSVFFYCYEAMTSSVVKQRCLKSCKRKAGPKRPMRHILGYCVVLILALPLVSATGDVVAASDLMKVGLGVAAAGGVEFARSQGGNKRKRKSNAIDGLFDLSCESAGLKANAINGLLGLFLAAAGLKNAARDLVSTDDKDLNEIQLALKYGLCLLKMAVEGKLDEENFKRLVRSYRDAIANAVNRVKGGEYNGLVNQGEGMRDTDTEAIAILNYATTKEPAHQTPDQKACHNMMIRTSCCVRLFCQSLPRFLAREASTEASSIICGSLAMFDACAFAFDNEAGTKTGYYKKVDTFCKHAKISRAEFYLINALNIWFEIVWYHMTHEGKPAPVIVASSYAHDNLFDGIDPESTTHINFCGYVPHPQSWMMEVYKALGKEALDEFNIRLTNFFRHVPEVDIAADVDFTTNVAYDWGTKMTAEEVEELKALRRKGQVKGGETVAEAWRKYDAGKLGAMSEKERALVEKGGGMVREAWRKYYAAEPLSDKDRRVLAKDFEEGFDECGKSNFRKRIGKEGGTARQSLPLEEKMEIARTTHITWTKSAIAAHLDKNPDSDLEEFVWRFDCKACREAERGCVTMMTACTTNTSASCIHPDCQGRKGLPSVAISSSSTNKTTNKHWENGRSVDRATLVKEGLLDALLPFHSSNAGLIGDNGWRCGCCTFLNGISDEFCGFCVDPIVPEFCIGFEDNAFSLC